MGLQSFAYDLQTQIPPGYIPINVPVQSYAPSISSHISQGSVHRLSNVFIPGYERSNRLELPNPASSSRQIIPLEPDFSQVSDPSVMIEPPNSNDLSISRPSRKDQSKREHKSKKRRRHRSSSSSILPDQTLWVLLGERKIQRDLSTLIKREEDDRWRLLLHQIPPNLNLTLVDIQGLINLPWGCSNANSNTTWGD